MYSTYRLKADELNSDFINALKENYRNRRIEIIVQEIEDETEYLLRTPANREHLLASVRNVQDQTSLIEIEPDSLES